MEEWEEAHIKRNLQSLVKLTFCHVDLLSTLEAHRVLSGEEVQQIMAKNTDREKAKLLYRILPSRKNAYEILTAALMETRQSGASAILVKTPTDKIANLTVQFLGKAYQVKKLLTSEEITKVQKCVQKTVSPEECDEIEENVFKSETPVQLVRDTIPAPDPLYIPRFLSQRLDINPEVFKIVCADVFVFKNVERMELRKFIGRFNVECSEEILKRKKPDCRFILLTSDNHWDKLCSRIAFPQHLIRFDSSEQGFVLEASTGDSKVLSTYLQRGNCQNISEAEFVRKTVEDDIGSVCICDLPGMGKSLLLASMARQVNLENREKGIVAFIQLSQLDIEQQSDCHTILEYISTSVLAKLLLAALIRTHTVKWFLFFDGLDEVKSEDLERTAEFLRNIRNSFPTAKIFVTSRPVVRQQLEKACQAISYDILPFDAFTQVQFLTFVWRQEYPAQDSTGFEEYAKICLRKLEALGPKEKEIAGVPLQCKMIAELFSDEASYYAKTKELFVQEVGCTFKTTLLEIYRLYLQRQIKPSTCKYKCMEKQVSTCGASCRVRSFHAWQAIQLLYPKSAKRVMNSVSKFEDLSIKDKFAPALLKPSNNPGITQTLEFSHRTFAEYMVSEYLAEFVHSARLPLRKSKHIIQRLIFAEFLLLRESVVAYFLNAFVATPDTETSLSLEICSASSSLSNDAKLLGTIHECVRHDFGYLLKSLTSAKMSANRLLRSTRWKFWMPNWNKLRQILEAAVEICSVSTVQTLVQFFEHQYTPGVLRKILALHQSSVIARLCWRADYELASIFVDATVTLQNTGVLIQCLEHTCFQSLELVEKRIDIAQLFLSKRDSLSTEPYSRLPGPLFTLRLHPKCFQFLIDNGADVRRTKDGYTFLAYAASYLDQAGIRHVCRYIFVRRPIRDLLFILGLPQSSLHFRFPFRRVRLLIRLLHLISTQVLTRSDEQFELVWRAGVEPSEGYSTRAELLTVLGHPEVLEKYQRSYLDLFFVAVLEGDVEVADVLLNHDLSFLEHRLETQDGDKTPVHLAVQCWRVGMCEYLVSKGANIFARDRHNRTVLHEAAETQDEKVFQGVVELLAKQTEQWRTEILGNNENFASFSELFDNMTTESFLETPLHMLWDHVRMRNEFLETLIALSRGTPSTGLFLRPML